MKAIRKSDGKVIEVGSTPYFNMKTDEEYRRGLFDGKHYKLSDLDFNVEEAEEVTNIALEEALVGVLKDGNSISWYGTERQLIDLVIRHFNRKYPDSEVTITIKPKKQ